MGWRHRKPKVRCNAWLPKLTTQVRLDRICTKQQHATNDEARMELVALLESGGALLEDLNLYQCSICNGAWHVGHRQPSRELIPLRPPRAPRAPLS
jgi:hypothetical protein